jgi:ATP-dependent protease ClpP protease subunit
MVWVDFFFTPGAANSSLRARFVTTLLQYRSAIIQVAGIPKVAFQTNSELHLEWVDIFHRLVEAGYYLIATEITSDTANPIIGGLLHYGSSGRFMLLINAPGGDLYSGAALVDCLRSRETSIYTVVLGIAASVAYLLAITATDRYGMLHCRLIHHGIEGGKAGRVGLIARSSSQFHRLAQLLLGPAEHGSGGSGALVLTGNEAILLGLLHSLL